MSSVVYQAGVDVVFFSRSEHTCLLKLSVTKSNLKSNLKSDLKSNLSIRFDDLGALFFFRHLDCFLF